MTAHDKASQSSRSFCDLLLSLTKAIIENANRKEAGGCCSIGVKTRFAYAYHRRRGIRVYLYSEEADGPTLTALAAGSPVEILKRQDMGSAWARLSPYYLDLDSEPEVRSAIPLLAYASGQIKEKQQNRNYLQPSEVHDGDMFEGGRTSVQVSRIERDPMARKKCIEIYGTICFVCGFNFERVYGEIGLGFTHVHHLNPLAKAKTRRKVNPIDDLRPVCANCHEMLHKQNPPFSIEELKSRISRD